MGQKTNPISNRLLITTDWQSKWFGGKNMKKYLVEDLKIRDFITKKLTNAGVERVDITRSQDKLEIKLTSSKPGLIIGRGGQGITALRDEIKQRFFPTDGPALRLDIIENRKPELSASLVAQSIGSQIERRIAYRRACKQAVEKTMASRAAGVKITISGRLNGAEIAREETFQQGTIPLSQLSTNIDFAVYHSQTTYGTVGIKVWINRGEQETEPEAS